ARTVGRVALAVARFSTLGNAGPDLLAKYSFEPATTTNKGTIMDVTLRHFFTLEPHMRALGITEATGRDLIDSTVTKALAFPYSYMVVHKASGKIVGVRLMSAAERQNMDEPLNFDIGKLDESCLIFLSILYNLYKDFWRLRPEAQKVLCREMTFVHSDHQRQGIAQHLVHLGLDFDKQEESGIDGIMSEASSFANQKLLAKNGYEELEASKKKEYIRSNGEPVVFHDATSSVKLVYLNLQKP
ncbi:hypothetical protein PENTCL1PPCAC_21261, partial [Pristionchus entomophagus]